MTGMTLIRLLTAAELLGLGEILADKYYSSTIGHRKKPNNTYKQK
jgi:hypothetical protein